MTFSQRTFSLIVVFLTGLLAALYASSQHLLPNIHDLATNFLVIVTPTGLILLTLNNWYSALDTMIANGTLQSSDIGALFTMSGFWVMVITCVSGEFEIVGIKVIDPDTQTVLVNLFLLASTVLLRSFTNRAVTPPASTKTAAPAG